MAWDKNLPAGTDKIQDSDDYIRANNAAIETAIDQDHDFATSGTQTGKHTVVTFKEQATPGASAANEAYLTAVDSGTQPELEFTSEDGTAVTLTAAGKIPGASIADDSVDQDTIEISNNSYLVASDNAGTGDVNLIKANASDEIELGTNTTVNGTLGTTGALTSGGNLEVTGTITGTSTLTVSGKIDGVASSTATGEAVHWGQFTDVSALGNNITGQSFEFPASLIFRLVDATIVSNVTSDTTNVNHGLTRCFGAFIQHLDTPVPTNDVFAIKQDSIDNTKVVFRNTNAFDVNVKVLLLGR